MKTSIGRYCKHGAVIPGDVEWLALAKASFGKRPESADAIAVVIDWCDICTMAKEEKR